MRHVLNSFTTSFDTSCEAQIFIMTNTILMVPDFSVQGLELSWLWRNSPYGPLLTNCRICSSSCHGVRNNNWGVDIRYPIYLLSVSLTVCKALDTGNYTLSTWQNYVPVFGRPVNSITHHSYASSCFDQVVQGWNEKKFMFPGMLGPSS